MIRICPLSDTAGASVRVSLLALLPLLFLFSASCGYQIGSRSLYPTHSIKVRIFDNISERRTHEFELTDVIVHELSSRGIRVNVSDAEYTLVGRILDIRTPSVVDRAKTDTVIVGSLQVSLEISLIDNETGDKEWEAVRHEAVSFTSARNETFTTARREVFDRLARWVLTRLEKKW